MLVMTTVCPTENPWGAVLTMVTVLPTSLAPVAVTVATVLASVAPVGDVAMTVAPWVMLLVVAPLNARVKVPPLGAPGRVMVWMALVPVMLLLPVSVMPPAPATVRPPVPVSVLLIVIAAPLAARKTPSTAPRANVVAAMPLPAPLLATMPLLTVSVWVLLAVTATPGPRMST